VGCFSISVFWEEAGCLAHEMHPTSDGGRMRP